MSLPGDNTSVKTTCAYCGVGCGIVAYTDKDGRVSVEGDKTHPANFGKLCSKGAALAETLGDEDRLLYPQVGCERVSWNTATTHIANRFSNIIAKHGPDAVAFYVSGQCLTEDYYVANKLMKGYIGSANIDTNSRLCMASSVIGHKRAFGADIVPGCYEDLEEADLIILTGSNLAWCHPVLYQRIAAAKRERPEMKVVVIDPRETASCDIADLHLALAPGSDVALFQGLLNYLSQNAYTQSKFVSANTENAAAALASAAEYSLDTVADLCDLDASLITQFYRLYAETARTVTVYSQGVNQAKDGSDKVNAIINCHLLTGRIGKVGAGPFSVTGQPNAMGGREVGGLANQLASHMEIANPTHRDIVQRFWGSPAIPDRPGLLAVDLFEAIHAGKVKAVWIMATNPVDSMPNANRVKEALEKCDLVVVSDVVAHTDTVACADIVLPASAWGEKDGTITNSERRISRQRAFASAPGEAIPDWQALCDVAKKMGWGEAFDFKNAAEVFDEYARLCAFENDGTRDLDLAGLIGLTTEAYDSMAPVQWPVNETGGTKRFIEDGKFFTKSGKANFVVPRKKETTVKDSDYPFTLNTGRIRDHWHTMTRTGRAARLSQHISEPFAEIHPYDADRLGLNNADIAALKTRQGQMLARIVITKRQQAGSVFVPMHFTDQFASSGRVDALTAPVVDPDSGQPAFKSTPASVQKYAAQWYGFAAIAADVFDDVQIPESAAYWAKARTDAGLRVEMAGTSMPADWSQFLGALLGEVFEDAEGLTMVSPIDGQTRLACFKDGALLALLFTSRGSVSVSRDWACAQLRQTLQGPARHRLLAGRPGADMPDKGAIVCACMNVGVNDILCALKDGHNTVEAVGICTAAGTNCGSCQPEIRALLEEASLAKAS